jgi:hypothetical protein
MKKKVFLFSFGLVIFFSLFVFLKWDQVKYYFSLDNTEVKIIGREHDFGNVSLGDTLSHTFVVKNIGSNILTLKNVLPSCKCVIVEKFKKDIPEKDSVKIKIQFIVEDKGLFEKTVVVESNTAPPFHVVRLNGFVK